MKAYSSNDIKQELASLPPKKLIELCLRLVRFKKENKELLSFLLFNSHDEPAYVSAIKEEMDDEFAELPKPNWFHTKKALRKILRSISKYSKYTNNKESEVEMRLHFCRHLNKPGKGYKKVTAIVAMYAQQLKKIDTLINLVHEDLQYDYRKELEDVKAM
ncbi:hypothetical protein [Aridibaculum aurantiacum]|uniref:hypothetical protein n=1 Tax=Aridibaculum aurantiacum TaxID=2810307 RepID=UPI001A968C75|nr:hypothetical protein [Aridibaculum aurantiacum]